MQSHSSPAEQMRFCDGRIHWWLICWKSQKWLQHSPACLDNRSHYKGFSFQFLYMMGFTKIKWPSGYHKEFPPTLGSTDGNSSLILIKWTNGMRIAIYENTSTEYDISSRVMTTRMLSMWKCKLRDNLKMSADYTGPFWNFSSQFSVPKWKKMFNWQEAIFQEIVDVKKLLVGCQSFCLHSFILSDCKWHGTVKETTCSVSGLLFYFRDLRHNCTLHKLSEVQIALCPQTVSWKSLL